MSLAPLGWALLLRCADVHVREHGLFRLSLHVGKLEETKKGFVLLPCRWVVGRSFARTNRFHRLVKDYECLPETLKGLGCTSLPSPAS